MTDDDGTIRRLLGQTFRERRIALDLSQTECADRCHVRQVAVSGWERGAAFPSIPNLIMWARALGLSLGVLDGLLDDTNGGEAAA